MERLEELRAYIKEKGKMVVAFSGGVDSTFLLAVAHEVLGSSPQYGHTRDGPIGSAKNRLLILFCLPHNKPLLVYQLFNFFLNIIQIVLIYNRP